MELSAHLNRVLNIIHSRRELEILKTEGARDSIGDRKDGKIQFDEPYLSILRFHAPGVSHPKPDQSNSRLRLKEDLTRRIPSPSVSYKRRLW